jgi:hypothetical protein
MLAQATLELGLQSKTVPAIRRSMLAEATLELGSKSKKAPDLSLNE